MDQSMEDHVGRIAVRADHILLGSNSVVIHSITG